MRSTLNVSSQLMPEAWGAGDRQTTNRATPGTFARRRFALGAPGFGGLGPGFGAGLQGPGFGGRGAEPPDLFSAPSPGPAGSAPRRPGRPARGAGGRRP